MQNRFRRQLTVIEEQRNIRNVVRGSSCLDFIKGIS